MRRILSCMIVGMIALVVILFLKRNGQLSLLSEDLLELWVPDAGAREAAMERSMPLPPILFDLFGGLVAAGAAWVSLDVRSVTRQLMVFTIAVLVVISAPAVWLRTEVLFDSAPIVVGLIIGVVGGQIAAGLTWTDTQRAKFREMMQNRCEDWVCERLAEYGALTNGEEFPAVVVAVRPRGKAALPERLHYQLQSDLKKSGAIVDDSQLQDLVGVFPTVHSPSEVARLVLDSIEQAKETCQKFASNEGKDSNLPNAFCVVVRFGDMTVRQIRRLNGQRDIAVSGKALHSALEWLFADRPWVASDEQWSLSVDGGFSSIDAQLSAVREPVGEINGAPVFTMTGEPEPVPKAAVVAPTAKAKARVIKSHEPEEEVVEEKVVSVKPRRIRLKVESSDEAKS